MRKFALSQINRILVVFLIGAGSWGISVQCAPPVKVVRQPAVAGSFYPADSSELRLLVEKQLASVQSVPEVDGDLIALVVPHAGLIYSGPVAAYSYKLLAGHQVNKVILCGPSHRVPFRGLSVYGPGVAWKTPLGEVRCDDDLCAQLLHSGAHFTTSSEPQLLEHSLEVQLPFLQMVLSDFTIVPVVMGRQDAATIDELASALEKLPIEKGTVMIASSDWQHYRPADIGDRMDSIAASYIGRLDLNGLESCFRDGTVEACGYGLVLAVAKAAVAKGANRVRILKVGDSGDATGDKSSVVGYIAAAFYRSPDGKDVRPSGANTKKDTMTTSPAQSGLSESDKQKLLIIARQSIVAYLDNKDVPDYEVSDRLKVNGAAFVTLTEQGQLRGCIGTVEAYEPLYRAVSQCAVSAAASDPRFDPVRMEEVSRLAIEISVLSPLTRVIDFNEIEVGRDGLMIRLGGASGLLLPQVASEYGWDRRTFLEQTCLKAGLPRDAYLTSGASIYRFQAVIFDEVVPAKP